jgi:hypothetical protein
LVSSAAAASWSHGGLVHGSGGGSRWIGDSGIGIRS